MGDKAPTTAPAPLTPENCDLQDFKFMPLDVARLRDSDMASDETPEACWAAVLLWAASWHQIPAASMPNNEQWIAKAAGYAQRGKIDLKAWKEVRSGAMRGYVLCTDGRWYHPVVAEKALAAWEEKLDQRYRTEAARIKKHNDRHGTSIPKPTFEEWLSLGCPQGQRLFVPGDTPGLSLGTEGNVPRETRSKGEREGQGQGQGQGSSSVAIATGGDAPPPDAGSDLPLDPLPDGPWPPKDDPAAAPIPPTPIPEDEKARLWFACKCALVEQGKAKATKEAGTLVGKLASKYGNDVLLDALRLTMAEPRVDTFTFLVAMCETAAGKRVPLNRQEAIEAGNQAAGEEFLRDLANGTI